MLNSRERDGNAHLVLAGPGRKDAFLVRAIHVDQIRDTLTIVEEALGQSDLRRAFDAEFTRLAAVESDATTSSGESRTGTAQSSWG